MDYVEKRQESLELKCSCTLLYSSSLKPKNNSGKASYSCIMTFKLFPIIHMFTHMKCKWDSSILAATHRTRRLISKYSYNLMKALTEWRQWGGRRETSERPLGGRVWRAVFLPRVLLLVSPDSFAWPWEPWTGWIFIWDMTFKNKTL